MANVFDEDVELATELIEEFGEEVTWVEAPVVSGGTPGYPGTASDPVKHEGIRIAFFSPRDLGMGSEMFLALLKDTEVPVGTEIGLMTGAVPFTPLADATIVRTTGEIAIDSLDRLAPNGLPILYFVKVKG